MPAHQKDATVTRHLHALPGADGRPRHQGGGPITALLADPDRAAFYRQIGIRLVDRRGIQGLSQVDVGRRIGIGQSVVSRMEAGTQAIPLDVFMSWCDALSLEPIDILGGTP